MRNRIPCLSDTQCFRVRNMTNIDGGKILTEIIEGHPANDRKDEKLQSLTKTISQHRTFIIECSMSHSVI